MDSTIDEQRSDILMNRVEFQNGVRFNEDDEVYPESNGGGVSQQRNYVEKVDEQLNDDQLNEKLLKYDSKKRTQGDGGDDGSCNKKPKNGGTILRLTFVMTQKIDLEEMAGMRIVMDRLIQMLNERNENIGSSGVIDAVEISVI
jgi:hypothetical protein